MNNVFKKSVFLLRIHFQYSIICLAILSPLFSLAQDTIVYFDRPGVGDGPYITQKGKINIESGWSYSHYFGNNVNFIPGILARKQISPSNEVRIMYDYAPQSLLFLQNAEGRNFTYLSIGSKQRISRTPNSFADMALTGNIFYPLNQFSNLNSNPLCFDAYLVFENNAKNGNYINYSIGYIYAGNTLRDILQFSFAANAYVGKFMVFAEYFAYLRLNFIQIENGCDGGILYEFNGNMQIDFSVIWNNFTNQMRLPNTLFFAVGYSYCFGNK